MMKRYLYIALLCACAMFGSVGNTAAQIKSGDIVTICYEATDRNGNVTSTNYLYADGTSINDKTTYDESCLWKITISGTSYSFQNVKTPTYYLYTSRSGNTYSLTLGIIFNTANKLKTKSLAFSILVAVTIFPNTSNKFIDKISKPSLLIPIGTLFNPFNPFFTSL